MKALACVFKAGEYFANGGSEFSQLKANLTDTARDLKRVVRKTRGAAEDFVDDVATAVKKQPLRSAGIAFGAGIGVGALAGWFGKRR